MKSLFKRVNVAYIMVFAFLFSINDVNAQRKRKKDKGKAIKSYIVANSKGKINHRKKTIEVNVPIGTNFSSLTPIIEVSNGVTMLPKPNSTLDFSKPVTYKITQNGVESNYTVTVTDKCTNVDNVHSFTYNNHRYEIIKENKRWDEAAKCAIERGGYLIEINNAQEELIISKELNNNVIPGNTRNRFSFGSIWLGGNDKLKEGKWLWDGDNNQKGTQFWNGGKDGVSVNSSYTNWGDEPDNAGGGQDVLSMNLEDTPRGKKFQWNDINQNSNKLFFIIEYDTIKN